MIDISIIICCYNSRSRITPTLNHLQNSRLPPDFAVEVILVDNNCSDDTVAVAKSSWYWDKAPLRVVSAPVPGLIDARKMGMAAATGNIFLFLDDDNWPSEDYLASIWRVFEHHAATGVAGGRSIAVFGGDKPDWFDAFSLGYGISDPMLSSGNVKSVIGAGMAIRREVVEELSRRDYDFLLKGRTGTALSSGEDTEMCYAARMMGWDCRYVNEATFQHYIPHERLTSEYLCRLQGGLGASYPILAIYTYVEADPRLVHVLYRALGSFLKNLTRVCFSTLEQHEYVHYHRHRTQAVLANWRHIGVSGVIATARHLGALRSDATFGQ